jgi:hypothetical protein
MNTMVYVDSLVIQWGNVSTLAPFNDDFTALVQHCGPMIVCDNNSAGCAAGPTTSLSVAGFL